MAELCYCEENAYLVKGLCECYNDCDCECHACDCQLDKEEVDDEG